MMIAVNPVIGCCYFPLGPPVTFPATQHLLSCQNLFAMITKAKTECQKDTVIYMLTQTICFFVFLYSDQYAK